MPDFRNRVLMLDLARLMEYQDCYRFWLPWLKEWGYNTLHLHLTDDEGCALVFPRRPELASPGAFTAEQMRAFVAGFRRGLSLVTLTTNNPTTSSFPDSLCHVTFQTF